MSPSPTSSAAATAAAAAAAAAAFTAQSWLGQIPTAPPGQLPPSSLWGLHGKDVKTEQQIVVSNSLLLYLVEGLNKHFM